MPILVANILTASGLRQSMAEYQAERWRSEARQRERAQRTYTAFVDTFLHEHLNRQDLAEARTRILAAAARGLSEAMVMRFPSTLCSDSGRAIGNAEPDWPESLPGKAREAYLLWERLGKPNGFHFRAAILDYPGGMPGDVGLFLDWTEPPAL